MKGYKDFAAADHLVSSAPKNEDFNPYDYIDQSHYRNTARGRMAYQEDLAKLLYMAQINQEERMNEYNSEQSQVERQKLAGLNPDLNGVQSNPASNVASVNENPMDGTQSTLQNVGDVFGIMSSVVSMVSSIYGGIDSIFSVDGALNTMQNAVSLFESAPSSLDIPSFINSSKLTARQKRKINSLQNSYISSFRGTAKGTKEQIDYYKSKGDYFSTILNPLYNQGIFEDFEQEQMAFAKVWKPIIDAQNELLLNDLKGKNSLALFNQGRWSKEFGETEKQFHDARYKLYQSLRGPINETLLELKKLDNRYPWAIYARGAVSALMLNFVGNLE